MPNLEDARLLMSLAQEAYRRERKIKKRLKSAERKIEELLSKHTSAPTNAAETAASQPIEICDTSREPVTAPVDVIVVEESGEDETETRANRTCQSTRRAAKDTGEVEFLSARLVRRAKPSKPVPISTIKVNPYIVDSIPLLVTLLLPQTNPRTGCPFGFRNGKHWTQLTEADLKPYRGAHPPSHWQAQAPYRLWDRMNAHRCEECHVLGPVRARNVPALATIKKFQDASRAREMSRGRREEKPISAAFRRSAVVRDADLAQRASSTAAVESRHRSSAVVVPPLTKSVLSAVNGQDLGDVLEEASKVE